MHITQSQQIPLTQPLSGQTLRPALARSILRHLIHAGFPRERTQFPVVYPTASSPQAWAAATPVLLLQILLGLVPDRRERVLRSDAADLPDWADGIVLEGVHAFGREWTARVERGAVTVE